jgi:hypothetical protein
VEQILSVKMPEGLWSAFLYEMKKYKSFRAGYRDGKEHGLQSRMLLPQADTSYRHKLGVLVACFESGLITDLRLERETLAVKAFKGSEVIYQFVGREEGRTPWNRSL